MRPLTNGSRTVRWTDTGHGVDSGGEAAGRLKAAVDSRWGQEEAGSERGHVDGPAGTRRQTSERRWYRRTARKVQGPRQTCRAPVVSLTLPAVMTASHS
jgi:hypothetical protein